MPTLASSLAQPASRQPPSWQSAWAAAVYLPARGASKRVVPFPHLLLLFTSQRPGARLDLSPSSHEQESVRARAGDELGRRRSCSRGRACSGAGRPSAGRAPPHAREAACALRAALRSQGGQASRRQARGEAACALSCAALSQGRQASRSRQAPAGERRGGLPGEQEAQGRRLARRGSVAACALSRAAQLRDKRSRQVRAGTAAACRGSAIAAQGRRRPRAGRCGWCAQARWRRAAAVGVRRPAASGRSR